MKSLRVKHKVLEKLSKKTGINKSVLSDYLAGRRVVPTGRVFFLEDMTGIPARTWVYGTPDERKAALNDALSGD